jgi:hypothetical protein
MILSLISPGIVEVVVLAPASSLLHSMSNASSIQSHLSSHHSDDDILEEALETRHTSAITGCLGGTCQ